MDVDSIFIGLYKRHGKTLGQTTVPSPLGTSFNVYKGTSASKRSDRSAVRQHAFTIKVREQT